MDIKQDIDTVKKYHWSEILKFNSHEISRSTIKRYYKTWREENNIAVKCDNTGCFFHNNPLIWNNLELRPILDHKDGNKYDNSPQNLRFLCPNCDSQLNTRGGKNKGRVKNLSENGYEINNQDGTKIIAAIGKSSSSGMADRVSGE